MESILQLMTDDTFNGSLDNATQSIAYFDCLPVSTRYQYREDYPVISPSRYRYVEDYPNDPEEEAHDHICILLSECLHRQSRTREKAERAIELIEQYNLTNLNHYIICIVHFPDLLERLLAVYIKMGVDIHNDILARMFARCIEHRPEEDLSSSMAHLLSFSDGRHIEIKLLPGKYTIDKELYEVAKKCNVGDSYYDATEDNEPFVYTHLDIVAKEKSGHYTGFRDAYHCLLYGDCDKLQALIVRWDIWGEDCTTDAAREFFSLDADCPIDIVIECVNAHSNGL